MIRNMSRQAREYYAEQKSLEKKKSLQKQRNLSKSPKKNLPLSGGQEYVPKKWYDDEKKIRKSLSERLEDYESRWQGLKRDLKQNLSELRQENQMMSKQHQETIGNLTRQIEQLKKKLQEKNSKIQEPKSLRMKFMKKTRNRKIKLLINKQRLVANNLDLASQKQNKELRNKLKQTQTSVQEISQKISIGPENVKCLNDYLKGTSYARKNKPNLQSFNKPDYYMYVFKEFFESRKLFIFSSSYGNLLLDLSKELQNQDVFEDDLKVSVKTIREQLFKEYSSKLGEEEIFPATRLVFPFAFKNQFDIKLIEFLPQTSSFVSVLGKALPEDEQTQKAFNSILEGLLHIFQISQDPVVQHCVLSEQSAMALSTFGNHLPCLLALFAMHYEQEFKGQIVIDRFTIDRFFYTAQVLSAFYQQIKQKQQEINNFYDGTMLKYEENEDLNIVPLQIETTTENYELVMAMNSQQLKRQFLQSKQKTTLILYQVIMVEGSSEMTSKIKLAIYASLERGTVKPQITYFIVSKDAEEWQNLSSIFDMISEGDEEFDVTVYTDFTRHGGLRQYSDWTLPLWARTIQKRKLTPINAFRVLTFSMAPYYIAYKNMD